MTQDIRSTRRWQEARAAARHRDGNACVRCGSTVRLSVHHRIPLAHGGAPFDLANLETLCSRCHARADAPLRRGKRRRRGGGGATGVPRTSSLAPVLRAPSKVVNRFSTVVVR